jgi:hypothetical protein
LTFEFHPAEHGIGSNLGEVVVAKFPDRLITLGLMVLGSVLMATPLALWVAWSDSILLAVLAAGVMAGVLYCVLIRFEKPDNPGRSALSDHVRARNLPDKFVAELQKLHPFIHHHQPSGGPKYRMAMDRLKKRLYRGPG